jgi:glyoxylase-like metal-dependent hydrolase (beta-lactamase superfamily II)
VSDPRPIDVLHLGRDRVICCWHVGDVLVDPGPTSSVDTVLEALDGREPKALLLTHIHLDHAGASGTLVERWPDLEVYVHERGAPHLQRPEKLLESARRLYGADMDRLWGEVKPVPERNLRVLSGGETVMGGFEVEYTPGHASHHVSYFRGGVAYVGDTGGVRIEPAGLPIPPTPPPDIDLEAWHASLDVIAGRRPDRLALTHFGGWDDVDFQLGTLSRRLDAWAAVARERDEAGFIEAMTEEIARASDDDLDTEAAYAQAAPPDQLYAGLARYWKKREAA